jgi:hypothetical protein
VAGTREAKQDSVDTPIVLFVPRGVEYLLSYFLEQKGEKGKGFLQSFVKMKD